MKKTLITLAALVMASVASAADTWTEVDTNVKATWKSEWNGCYYYDLTFSLDFSFSENSLANNTSAIVAYITDGRTAGDAVQYTYVLNRDTEGVYTLTMGRTNATNDITALSYSSGGNDATQPLTAGTVYTLSGDDTYMGSKISWTVNGVESVNTRNYDDYVAVNTSLVSSAEEAAAAHHVMLNSAFVPSAITPDTPPVPEPTTATLSLLALAGLAARRRRK